MASYDNNEPDSVTNQPDFVTSQPAYVPNQPTYGSNQPAYVLNQPIMGNPLHQFNGNWQAGLCDCCADVGQCKTI